MPKKAQFSVSAEDLLGTSKDGKRKTMKDTGVEG